MLRPVTKVCRSSQRGCCAFPSLFYILLSTIGIKLLLFFIGALVSTIGITLLLFFIGAIVFTLTNISVRFLRVVCTYLANFNGESVLSLTYILVRRFCAKIAHKSKKPSHCAGILLNKPSHCAGTLLNKPSHCAAILIQTLQINIYHSKKT